MTLVDTGPFVALFDPQDVLHTRCKDVLKSIHEPLSTTVPVLTQAFHVLTPHSLGAERLRDFVLRGVVSVWFMDEAHPERAFMLMQQYPNKLMDLADASLIVAAESLHTNRIFTVDRRDFSTYRIRRGHRLARVEIVG